MKLIVSLLVSVFLAANAIGVSSPREKLRMDSGWKFHLGNEWGLGQNLSKAGSGTGPASASFSDASWRTVNLPHDWAVELPFDQHADGSHGFHPVGPGFPQTSVAWYRRTFDLPQKDAGKRLWLEFDGVFRDCTVFVNGWFVGHHESGYSSFRYDITDVAHYGGSNVIAVKVDASEFEGWFYEGAGIYRHVWLVKTSPLAIAPDGVFVYANFENNTPTKTAPIQIETRLLNFMTNAAETTVRCNIVSPDGKPVATAEKSETIGGAATATEKLEASISAPQLWSPESPKLYKLVTTVESSGGIVDREETEFGIRTVAFDPDKGFLLNGQPYELKGTCNHQDHAGVGSALPDALQYFRVRKLKEMGCNAIRTSHNAPTPELLDACDRLGLLVMDENRLLGSDAANLHRFQGQIFRDRNHPSVAIWSLANEEFGVQDTPAGVRVATTMQDLFKRLDPTRPVTYAAPVGNDFTNSINSIIEVRGWNYHVGPDMEAYHREHPQQPNVGTEQGSTVSTRGIYTNDAARGYVSAYDTNAPNWAHTAETWWSYFAERPWLSGGFVWTGFDYRGEPTPYGWPCINSHFGILDTCGFPKDNFWYYQSWWTTNTVLHLLPHWNWPGREGHDIDVWCYSNCRKVELFLNGSSLGKQTMKKNSHLEWKVKYAPGVLSAKGFDADGKVIAETKVETTGAPAAVQLKPDRAAIAADGRDVSVMTVSVADAQGRIVPVASNKVYFALSGPGRILGVGNGDPSCHEPDQFIAEPTFRTSPVDDWRWKKIRNAYQPNLPEEAEQFDDASWETVNVNSGRGVLEGVAQAMFRGRANLTAEDLAAPSVELIFGRIGGDGSVYVNGQKAGESHNGEMAMIFDVKRLLHSGENTIAVAVANWGGTGGIYKGVSLQFQEKTAPVEWQRSVFNGVAQIIVQSTKEPGEIKLTASADGLSPAVLQLATYPAQMSPSAP
ncbi:MAG TPA: beta-galactosidase GalA [Verrucomicrobiae bacterium]|nr:beta-galactosidase GalA [Verrucomicrobiae bacterium]